MSDLVCPDCNGNIKLHQKSCKYCGAELVWKESFSNKKETTKASKEGLSEKSKIILIIGCLIFIPISYYFFYALPKHNESIENLKLQELEYQKEKDNLETERIINEKQEKEFSYNTCIEEAKNQQNLDTENYCTAGYKECKVSIDEYNKEYGNTYEYDGTSRKKDYSSCEKYLYKDGGCMMSKGSVQKIDTNFENAKDDCIRLYGN